MDWEMITLFSIRSKNELELNKDNVAMLCNRNMGLGSDGILEGPYIGRSRCL